MSVVRKQENTYMIFGPGCKCVHAVNNTWEFNGDLEKPTFSPSILVKSGHYMPDHKGDCWCKFNENQLNKGEKPSEFKCVVCHSFVTDGKIQFLSDCTHAMAGQTIELGEF